VGSVNEFDIYLEQNIN